MWIEQLKIAVLERNVTSIDRLLENHPSLDAKDAIAAANLLDDMSQYLEGKKDKVALGMRQLKKNIDFVKSTEPRIRNKLDIKS